MNISNNYYPPAEERLNISSHVLGALMSVVALVLMVVRAQANGSAWHVFSVGIFGASLVTLYLASAVYHSTREPTRRARMRIIDHSSIYILIAGTYTPFTLVTLQGKTGWILFGITWGMALAGVTLKLFFTGRFRLLSTLMYVFMGWLIVFAIKPLINNFPLDGLYWLIAGGAAYTLGAVLYSIRKLPFNHAIFHLFVVLGSFCHVVAVYFWVIPSSPTY